MVYNSKMKLRLAIILSLMPGYCFSQKMNIPPAEKTEVEQRFLKTNILYFNPIHISKGNITLSYEKFIQPQKSYKITLSGGEKENYISGSFDANYYFSSPALINYFLGMSLSAYESPIITGVPVYKPFNKFSESLDDQYYVGLQLKNGALFRLSRFMVFEIDAAIGPFYNLSESKWLAVWAINLNLGIPF